MCFAICEKGGSAISQVIALGDQEQICSISQVTALGDQKQQQQPCDVFLEIKKASFSKIMFCFKI